MPIFGSKEKDRKIRGLTQQVETLRRQNQNLTQQIRKYEGRFENIDEMRGIIDRLKKENQDLVSKLEKFVVERQQMRETIEKLKKDLIMKREQIEMKTFAVNSENTDVVISKGVIINGGINAKTNVQIQEKAQVNGDIKITGDLTTENEVHIKGFIEADNITLGDGTEVEDSVRAKGKIETGIGCTLNLVFSEEDLHIGNSTQVMKAVGGNVILGDSVVIKDGIEYSESMKIGSNVTIQGEIRTKS
jgi:NDP-sugar pyrophosphorylase family protein